MANGWIKIYRNSINNPVFQKPLIWHYFQYCLLKANHEDKEIIWNKKRMIIERGSFITGRKKAAKETGLSEQNIRTALDILGLQGMVLKSTTKSTSKFTYLTVCNYEHYQENNDEANQQTNQQLTSNQPQTRTNKNKKNIYKDFVHLGEKEFKKLVSRFGDKKADELISRLNNYIGQIGEKAASKKYKSHYHVILNWHHKDNGNQQRLRPTKVAL